ncbi:hypothetical protein DPMN_058068 [Dreissena polymorpha]|uniref:Uncharacterized protein n=1 Tax=Dreissena polymorpha TaxID=45954 RepID=A0A9D4C123_DREPO|nr:hypothetical protein DPMN_058068 [Dreissena polymorpha]
MLTCLPFNYFFITAFFSKRPVSTCNSSTITSYTFRPDVQLIDSDLKSMSEGDVELGDVEISNPRLEQLIRDTHWVDDVRYVRTVLSHISLCSLHRLIRDNTSCSLDLLEKTVLKRKFLSKREESQICLCRLHGY